MTLKPYPRLKDSGAPWLGEVPEHWEVRRLKRICRLAYGDALATDVRQEGAVPVYGSNGCVGTHSVANTKAPCIVVGRKGSFGKINFSYQPVFAIDTTFFIDGRFTTEDMRWLHLVLEWLRLDEVSKDSAVPGLDREDAYKRVAAVPPLPEQEVIVRFLDHAEGRIRRYIGAKQRLVKLLEEQRQAIVHQAVTRGLDPTVPLKPSGIPWLGDIPAHWEVRKLGTLFCRRGSGTTPAGDHYYGGSIPWVMTGDLNDAVVAATKRAVTADAVKEVSALRIYRQGALIVAMYGATIGKTGILSMDACTNQACYVLAEPRKSVSVEFLQAVLKVAKPSLIEQSYGGGQPNINAEIVRGLKVPVPPRPEQDEILRQLAYGSVQKAMASAKREIELLSEYRTRLIADVVTGKVDVRAHPWANTEPVPGDLQTLADLDESDADGDEELLEDDGAGDDER